MITWGWTGMAHDASLAVFDDQQLVLRHMQNATVESRMINI